MAATKEIIIGAPYLPRKNARVYHFRFEKDPDTVVEMPRVTTYIGVLDKPALVPWADKMGTQAAVDAACKLYEQHTKKPLDIEIFRELLERRAKDEKASIKARNKAGDLGTDTHAVIEGRFKRELGIVAKDKEFLLKKDVRIRRMVNAFGDWKKDHKVVPLLVEQMVYFYDTAMRAWSAGRLDWVGLVDDQLAILDWKSGKSVYDEAYLQSSAYRMGLTYAIANSQLPELERLIIKRRQQKKQSVIRGLVVRLPKEEDDELEVVDVGRGDDHYRAYQNCIGIYQWTKEQKRRAGY